MRSLYLILISFIFSASAVAQSNVVPDNVEFQILKDLWDSTAGTGWTTKTNWPVSGSWPSSATSSQFGTWYGVTVTNGDITSIVMTSNNLTGKLPSSISGLTKLKTLNLNSNHLSGSIPASIGSLTSLTMLALSANQLTGSIPSSIGNLTLLNNLSLSINSLSGPIPSTIGNLVNIGYFYLNNNQLTGQVPASIGNLTKVGYFYLNNNQLSGTLPDVFGGMSSVGYFMINNNQLTGPLPPSLGSASKLAYFSASSNKFSGTIPLSYASISTLVSFYVDQNQLTGEFPSFIGNWTKLREISIEKNQVNGVIPSGISNCTELLVFKAAKNRLTGAFPSLSATNIFYIDGTDNYFSSLPGSMTSLTKLTTVLFGNNELTTVPDFGSYSNRTNLVLNLQNNRLDFSKLELNVGKSIKTLTQTPQKNIKDIVKQPLVTGSSFVLTARPVGSSTVVSWEKQNSGGTWTALSNDEDSSPITYTRNSAVKADEGIYRWKTTSSLIPSTTIYSDPINVKTILSFAVDNWSFQYRYDNRKRMTHKKVPGADWVYMVYDKRDRVVLTQDGVQRGAKKWMFTRYDQMNRPVVTGIYTHGSSIDQAAMSALIDSVKFAETFEKDSSSASYSSFFKYTNTTMPSSRFGGTFEILTVTYYDNYDFIDGDGYFSYNPGRIDGQEVNATKKPRGQVTGVWTRVLGANPQWLRSVSYYDDKKRIIQSISDNHKGGQDIVTNVYDFAGKVTDSKTESVEHGLALGASPAFSTQQLGANVDGWIEFTCVGTGVASTYTFGFSTSTSASNVGYGIKQEITTSPVANKIRITVNGTPNGDQRNVAAGDVIRIERKGGAILYFHNGVKLPVTSSVSASQSLYAHAIVSSGSKLFNPKISIQGPLRSINRHFEYDDNSRLVKTYHGVDSTEFVLLSKSEYNELGQLIDKKLHSTDSATFRQSIDMRYNIRGWLTSMNGADLSSGDKNSDSANDGKDLFGIDLLYNNTISGIGNTAMYNGNISAMRWSTGLGLQENRESAYKFDYDEMNRLSAAVHRINNSTGWHSSDAFAESQVTYDLNGNIMGLSRTNETGTLMDKLSYDYGSVGGNQLQGVVDKALPQGFSDGTDLLTDYTYDSNGSMIRDNNKGITAITYNHLNLPEKVTKSTNEYLVYEYDASGRKLSQSVYNSSNVLKKRSDYRGDWFYENDTLKFANTEEGRVVMTSSLPEYQYHLKDHLGNVRMTFTTKVDAEVSKATVETENSTAESGEFLNYDKVRRISHPFFDHTYDGQTPPNGTSYAIRLSGSANEKTGLAKSLKVEVGDTLRFEVFAKYYESSSGGGLGTFASLMASIIAGTPPGGTFVDGLGYGAGGGSPVPYGPLSGKSSETGTVPKAYLNWLVFDKDYNLLPGKSGYKRITLAAKEDTTNVPHERLAPDQDIVVNESGYAYIYLSNENETPVEVYFDDFKVEHVKSQVTSSQDYYPFGLAHSSYQRENTLNNQYQYNSKEHQDELNLGWLDYGARMYQPEIGRWGVVDSQATSEPNWTPYRYGYDNPVRYWDFGGHLEMDPEAVKLYQALANYLTNGIQGVLKEASIMRAIMKYGQRSEQQIQQDLQWGAGPKVVVRAFSGEEADAVATFMPDEGSRILNVNKRYVDALEKMPPGKERDALLFRIAGAILHEYVHYGDDQDGVDYLGEIGEGEEGNAFEIEAYGMNINLISDSKRLLEDWLKKLQIKKEVDDQMRSGLKSMIDNFSSMDEGTYKWDGEQWVKE